MYSTSRYVYQTAYICEANNVGQTPRRLAKPGTKKE